MWRIFRLFPSIWRNFTSLRDLKKSLQSNTPKSAKTFLTVLLIEARYSWRAKQDVFVAVWFISWALTLCVFYSQHQRRHVAFALFLFCRTIITCAELSKTQNSVKIDLFIRRFFSIHQLVAQVNLTFLIRFKM